VFAPAGYFSPVMRFARATSAWAAVLLALCCAACNRSAEPVAVTATNAEAAAAVADTIATSDDESSIAENSQSTSDDEVTRIVALSRRGQFESFARAAFDSAVSPGENAALDSLRTEALLALGRNNEAEPAALCAVRAALDDDPILAAAALRLWIAARYRQGKTIDSVPVADALARLDADDPAVQMIHFWSRALGGRSAYQLSAPGDVSTLALPADAESQIADHNTIEAAINGIRLPRVFIDTGAQHTLMTRQAAREAGVALGSSEVHLVGFAKLRARPGLVDTLRIGNLTLHDVPVLVGDSTPLVAAKGHMALGTELMHHVRFTIDYPRSRVVAQPADSPVAPAVAQGVWEIPLWTFSNICLASGRLAGTSPARVLVDTGDRSGTFVSARWARRSMKQYHWPSSSLVFHFKPRGLALDEFQLGSETLRNWPVQETMPSELDRLDLVDVLVGRDVLEPYRLTIDLRRRVLRLQGPADAAAVNDAQRTATDTPRAIDLHDQN
jgi:predicted aspartyl protease